MTLSTETLEALDVDLLTGALGAELHGVRLPELDDDAFDAVRALLSEHSVLFFPEQHLTPDEHREFACRFGEAEIHPFIPKLDEDHPEIVVLDSERGAKADVWHTDVTFSESPPICSVLKMVQTPPSGGDTMWTSQAAAYEALSAPIRDLVDGLTAVHTADAFGHAEIRAEHPAVRVHPVTGRRCLYVNRQFTSHFPQLRPDESAMLLAHLCAFAEQPQFTVRYRWAPGTVGVWDNRATQHYAVNDYDGRRIIHRVTILGDRPAGDAPKWTEWVPARPGASELIAHAKRSGGITPQ